jgi:amino acid transporter
MIIRVIILILITVLHILTPHWFLDDFLSKGDPVMLFCGLLSLLMYMVTEKGNRLNTIPTLLGLISLVYFLTTVRIITPDVGRERVVCRLQLIFEGFKNIPVKIGEAIEIFNAILIVLNTCIVILIIIQFYRTKFKISKQKPRNRGF